MKASDMLRNNKFQFHKGTIRTRRRLREMPKWNKFQFHKGTIRTFSWWSKVFDVLYFNSIKVRLEHPLSLISPSISAIFQFHKGTIRTFFADSHQVIIIIFQFHKGTIRTFFADSHQVIIIIFQFHKGTIRTYFQVLYLRKTWISIP